MPVRSRRSESLPPSTGIRHPLRHPRLIQRCCPAARRSRRHLFLARYVYALTSSSSSSSIIGDSVASSLTYIDAVVATHAIVRNLQPLTEPTRYILPRDSHQTIYVEYRQ